MSDPGPRRGLQDTRAEVSDLRQRLPEPLRALAALAHNYWWSWAPDGEAVFRDLSPHRWALARHNPVRFLRDVRQVELEQRAVDDAYVGRVRALNAAFQAYLERPVRSGFRADRPVAFLCAEYGIHRSLPLYSGGLGVLAGDYLKQVSDSGVPVVGLGLLYRSGYFHQRLDTSGWQHEYWIDIDPDRLPAVQVTDGAGRPLTIEVGIGGRPVDVAIWRVDVGRVPLFLLDAELPQNTPLCRWVTTRLYESNRALRLCQYALLGIGGVRALRALEIDPLVYHLNEGHAALAGLELAAAEVDAGATREQALERTRGRLVFTTHTPVAAGNEYFSSQDLDGVVAEQLARLGGDPQASYGLGRANPADVNEPVGLTALAIRTSRLVNGVSERHGAVARDMWRCLFPGASADQVPIGHVTNGVHAPTWVARPMRDLLDRHLGPDWLDRATDPDTWAPVAHIPDGELWAARVAARRDLVAQARQKSMTDRLRRGEDLAYVQAAAEHLDGDRLTVGFARRLAAYKRLHLLTHDPSRALPLLAQEQGLQLLFAGKAHPADDVGKRILQGIFGLKRAPAVSGRSAFLEDMNLHVARALVSGCDVWLNLPRPPLEASGTSGMKAFLNGGLNLSVLDGWWAEAYDGENGWAIDGTVDPDHAAQDDRDAARLYDLLENEVLPEFHDRDQHGVPRRWVQRIKASLMSLGPRFCMARMVDETVRQIYLADGSGRGRRPG